MNEDEDEGYGKVVTLADFDEFECPKHGNIGQNYLRSDLPGHEGLWCLACWTEVLDASGVQRVKRVEKKKDEDVSK